MNKILIFIISLFCIVFFYEGSLAHFSERVFLTSIIIMLFSIYFTFSDAKRPFTLRKIFYLFSFFFFGIAPLMQFYRQTSSFNARLLKEVEYFHLNVLIIGIILLYEILYRLFSLRNKDWNPGWINRFTITTHTVSQDIMLILLAFLSLLYVLYSNDYNLTRLFFRGGEILGTVQKDTGLSTSLDLFLSQTVRPLGFVALLYYLLSPQRKFIFTGILFIISILTIFPAAVPRFYAAAVYIPLLLITIRPFTKKNIFSLTFIAGLLVVFPFLNNFRHFSRNTDLELKLDFGMFTEGHFDSYQNFALIYFEQIITWGRQLLGVLLFWMPRSVWPEKPIGSGYVLAHKMHFTWDNVSANYFAEGYINFGFLGIFLFVLFLSYITSLLDNLYWNKLSNQKHNFFRAVYLLLLGMLFFVMRGDLLSSTAFTVGFLFSIFIVYFIVHRRSNETHH